MIKKEKVGSIENVKLDNELGYNISICDRISLLSSEWDAHCGQIPYAGSSYLELLEKAGPVGYSYYYVLVKSGDKVIGLMYCQHKPLELHKDFRVHAHSNSLWEKTKVKITKSLFKFVKNDILICGNVLLTGEYGIRLDIEVDEKASILVTNILAKVRAFVSKHHKVKIKSTLLKDFYIEGPLKSQMFTAKDYTAFKVQPDMIVTLDKNWKSYNDYLTAVKSKYRVKFKKVKKKGAKLSFKLLSSEDAAKYNSAMYKMYKDTADRATFNMFLLEESYFGQLKQTFGNDIILYGVFVEEEMVAFFTYIRNGEVGDAHFLGYNVQLNNRYQIYFNILLKLVETAIEDQATYLNLSRTALEIKSSVGAKAYDMQVHLHYHIGWINRLLPFLLSKFVPENKWLPRSPFK